MSRVATRSFAERRVAWLGEALPAARVSFEFFPPRTPEGETRFWRTIDQLRPLQPHYVSVTCGAGGNPAAGTADVVDALRRRAGLDAAAHLTCASTPKAEVEGIARRYYERGVRHIVALRGDRPRDPDAVPGERYLLAAELVRALRRLAPFEISVAAYPEVHPEAASAEADLDNLKRKVEAGAARAITQYCFDTDAVLRLRDRMSRAGIEVPLAVGILPIHNFAQMKRFSEGCGAGVPPWLQALFDGLEDDPAQQALLGASVAAEQARRLIVEGIGQLHFYTLNRADLTVATCRLLGLRPGREQAAAA